MVTNNIVKIKIVKYSLGIVFMLFIMSVICCKDRKELIDTTEGLDTIPLKALTDQSFELYISNPDSGVVVGRKALSLCVENKWIRGQALAYNAIASNFFGKAVFDSAAFYFNKSIDLNHKIKNTKAIASNLNNIGSIYHRGGDFKLSIKYFDSAYKYYDLLKSPYINEKATILLNKGSGYYKLGEYNKGLKYSEESLRLFTSLKLEEKTGEVLNNIASIKFAQKKYLEANKNYNDALRVFNRYDYQIYVPEVLISQALIYLDCPDTDLKELGIKPEIRIQMASELISNAEKINKQYNNNLNIQDIHKVKADLYIKSKDFNRALIEKKLSDSINEVFLNATIKNKILFTTIEAKIKIEKEKERQKEKEKEELDERKNLSLSFGAISIIILIFVFCYITYFRNLPKSLVRNLGIIGMVSLIEFITFFTHYFLHHYISEEPWFIFIVLIVVALIIYPLHEKFMKNLEKKIEEREENQNVKKDENVIINQKENIQTNEQNESIKEDELIEEPNVDKTDNKVDNSINEENNKDEVNED